MIPDQRIPNKTMLLYYQNMSNTIFGGRKYFAKLVIPLYFLILWVKDPKCLKDKLKVEEGGTHVL